MKDLRRSLTRNTDDISLRAIYSTTIFVEDGNHGALYDYIFRIRRLSPR